MAGLEKQSSNNAIHLSRLQTTYVWPHTYGGQVMASVTQITGLTKDEF